MRRLSFCFCRRGRGARRDSGCTADQRRIVNGILGACSARSSLKPVRAAHHLMRCAFLLPPAARPGPNVSAVASLSVCSSGHLRADAAALVATGARPAVDGHVPCRRCPISRQASSTRRRSRVQFTISSYLFGFAVGQIFYGPISDRFGRKPVLLTAIVPVRLGQHRLRRGAIHPRCSSRCAVRASGRRRRRDRAGARGGARHLFRRPRRP